jgi:parallel beta-helix repeat protein
VGIAGTSTHAVLRNCRIMDNTGHGLELFDGSEPTLDHCLITANNQAGIMMHAGQGRRVSYCKPKLHYCYVMDNGEGALSGGQPILVDSYVEGP